MCSLATAVITSLRRRPLKGPCISDLKNSGSLKWIELMVSGVEDYLFLCT